VKQTVRELLFSHVVLKATVGVSFCLRMESANKICEKFYYVFQH